MDSWPPNPSVYEINTWAWLHDLSDEAGGPVTLGGVPESELARLAAYRFDALWLMGVWERSPGARRVSREHAGWLAEYREVLPDCTTEDIVGSPYAVRDYRVDPALGGGEELEELRARLRRMGLRLILDFVPNHFAVDHPWLAQHPERLMRGERQDAEREPQNYFSHGAGDDARVFAHGRDPYFDGWPDTVQLDYRRRETREAMAEALLSVAERCDGVRCDMAMLVTREVFLRTWGGEFDDEPAREFWPDAIGRVKARSPDFLTLAEVYWDMEYELQRQGFDYTYDKRLYDRLRSGDARATREHLGGHADYQSRLARFVENHDERRAQEAFGPQRAPAASTLTLTLPGLRLFHEGQLEGWRLKLPVHLGRRPAEPTDPQTERHYRKLLGVLRHEAFRRGRWRLLEPSEAWPGNPTHQNFVASCWTAGAEHRLVVVNLSDGRAQCRLPLGADELDGRFWFLTDLLSEARYLREGAELLSPGLYLDMPAHGFHVFEITPEVGSLQDTIDRDGD